MFLTDMFFSKKLKALKNELECEKDKNDYLTSRIVKLESEQGSPTFSAIPISQKFEDASQHFERRYSGGSRARVKPEVVTAHFLT